MKLLFATRNQGKFREVKYLCEQAGLEAISLNDIGLDLSVKEDGETFAANAYKKARAAFELTKMWVLGEDSGLEVDALGGKPGIMSARFGGEGATDLERNQRLLEMIIAVPYEKRTARFRCVMCLISPQGEEKFFEGVCEGKIAHTIRGITGFGYDPIFIPEGYGFTFAELGWAVKNEISHRARALRQVIEYLKSING
ncbi:RdgB/HAM1 family non-canonical purine NTP pyrophosphatase [candidate division WOR-3 bacterium]|nr:RdgB/HAM1 family non-canonical purine NTP pyrophosphatase [candidate division WOR-3 bacterium]